MAIYRGPGGAGDATGDATNASALALAAKDAAQASASSASASATAAANSAAAADTSATNASTQATNAAGSATTASTYATNAASSATTAASEASDAADSATAAASSATSASTDASTASTQASNASSSASSASTSASTATTKASEAATSATNAASSATAAAASAVTAATFDPALYLAKSGNLSGLANTATARDNLGVEIGVDVQAFNAALAAIAANNGTNMMKNRIINGAMMIDQRKAGASLTTSAGDNFDPDRWMVYDSVGSKMTAQQVTDAPSGFIKSQKITSLAATTPASTDYYFDVQRIEGFNVADLAWGTASAATVTLSFWVKSSLTGSFSGAFGNTSFSRSYPFSYTISAANTWEQKTVTVAGDTTGTWATDNSTGLQVLFDLGSGTSRAGAANTWSASDYRKVTGSVNLIGTNGATWQVTGVQLEKGSTATSFDYRPYGTELALCQRYLPAFIAESTLDSITNAVITSSIAAYVTLKHPVTARTRPTGVTASASNIITISGASVTSAIAFNNAGTEYTTLVLTSSGLTTGVAAATFLNTAGAKLLLTGCEL